jgi:hypothetical protein
VVDCLDDYKAKLKNLNNQNRKILLIALLSVDAAKIQIDNNQINLIVFDNGRFLISYDWIVLVFISMVKNRDEFLLKNRIVNKSNYVSNFSSGFIELIKKFLLESEFLIFNDKSVQRYIYFKTKEDFLVATSFLEISKPGEKLLNLYNSDDRLSSIKINIIDKNIFKESTNVKYNISFNSMFNI